MLYRVRRKINVGTLLNKKEKKRADIADDQSDPGQRICSLVQDGKPSKLKSCLFGRKHHPILQLPIGWIFLPISFSTEKWTV